MTVAGALLVWFAVLGLVLFFVRGATKREKSIEDAVQEWGVFVSNLTPRQFQEREENAVVAYLLGHGATRGAKRHLGGAR